MEVHTRGGEISRRNFLSKFFKLPLYFFLTPLLPKVNYLSHLEKQEHQESSEQIVRIIVRIVHDFFVRFYRDRKFVHKKGPNAISVLKKNYKKFITDIIGEINRKIKEQNIQTGTLKNFDDLKQYLAYHNIFFNSGLSSYFKKNGKNGEEEYVLMNIVMREINPKKSKFVSPKGYFPEYIGFSNEPLVPVLRLEKDLLPEIEKIKDLLGFDKFIKGGSTIKGGVIILFQEGVEYYMEKYNLSEQEAEQFIISNEMGHVIVGFIFRDAFKKFGNFFVNDASFSMPDGESFTFLQLQEAFSTLTQLKYGLPKKEGSEDLFGHLINDVTLRVIPQYRYTNYLFSQVIPAVLKDMKIEDQTITTPEQFEDFKERLMGALVDIIFTRLQSFVDFFKEQMEEKKQ